METLDQYFKDFGLSPTEEEIKEKGGFDANLSCLRKIGMYLAYDSCNESYEPYAMLLNEPGLVKSIPQLVSSLSHEDRSDCTRVDSLEYLMDYVVKQGIYDDVALVGLGEIGDRIAVPAINSSLSGSDLNRWWGIRALRNIGYEDSVKEIIKYLKKEEKGSYKTHAILEIGKQGSEEAAYILQKYHKFEMRNDMKTLIKRMFSKIRLFPK